jgi:aryl-alcohol dehydrogenase-like predicted oxidoreductase
MAQIGLAWLLSKRDITAPIVGATKIKHLEDAIAALDITLSADEIAALEGPYRPRPFLL